MGLDVYMYYCADRATTKAAEEAHEAFTEAEWEKAGKYDDLTKEEKDVVRATCTANAVSLGLTGEHESHPAMMKIEENSAKYPDHMFKIGYFRSSYNDGGMERVLGNLGIPALYDLFSRKRSEEYEFVPDWENVRLGAQEAVAMLKAKMGEPISQYYPLFVSMSFLSKPSAYPSNQEAAVKVFEKALPQLIERAAKPDDIFGGDYSSRDGYFSVKGLQVFAALPGQGPFHENGVYLMVKNDGGKDSAHPLTWYLNALEIVEETAEYVLNQPDPQHFYIHWSA